MIGLLAAGGALLPKGTCVRENGCALASPTLAMRLYGMTSMPVVAGDLSYLGVELPMGVDQVASTFPHDKSHDVEIGIRVLIDAHLCNLACCYSEQDLTNLVKHIAEIVGANILNLVSQKFAGEALTLVAILSSSHCVVHSWPELRFISIDLFVCNADVDRRAVIELVSKSLGASRVEAREMTTRASAR